MPIGASQEGLTRWSQDSNHAMADFIRIAKGDGGPKSLDTSVLSYRLLDRDVIVDLIGAIHIGEKSYYTKINQLVDQYDVFLYELVAEEGTTIPKGGRQSGNENPVAMLQGLAKSALRLELQLEQVDYTKKHMVRADLTPGQMAAKMEERGETVMTLALSTIADTMRLQKNLAEKQTSLEAELQDISLFDLFGNSNKLKRVMAQQFVSTGSLDQSLGGALNQLLVVDRNEAAIKELEKQMSQGKKRIGIFYGAAHMPDMEQRLKKLGFSRSAQQWLPAWNLR